MELRPDGFDPELDLVIDRELSVTVGQVWTAWTTPEHLREFFVPKPWTIAECEIDLRPGGRFWTVMQGPEGERIENAGCYLVVEPNRRLVFTDTLLAGFRPAPEPFFTAHLLLEPRPGGCRYVAVATHRDATVRKQHEEMGFATGWNIVVDQMEAYAKERLAG
jgi:uncharacterized protein YndB with AHSA1/START domain